MVLNKSLFSRGTSDKESPANEGDTRDSGLIPESRRCPGVVNDNLLQYSCLENSMDRGPCQATTPVSPWGCKGVGYD